ncbi:MAG: hypothetical protein B7C24_04650 [Bacteroidetes bacterium 4572_77]|nr:MAG: hypothetical protein B7C24_04650 [Bacteroidetes bacterium 4572_77]
MKNQISLIVFLCLSTWLFAQVNEEINPKLTNKTWVVDETRIINNYEVTLLDGADYGNTRNASTGMITSIAYNDESSPELEFYITRYEQSLANLKWFMVIIRDENDKEKIFEQKLAYKASELPAGNYYWNYTTIALPQNVHPPFYVYIRDRNIGMLYSSRFKVEKAE